MRYIMILSLCLAGFQGYAATGEPMGYRAPVSIAEDPFPMKGEAFADILDNGSITNGIKNWKMVSIYKKTTSDREDVFENYIYHDRPLPETAESITLEDAMAMLTNSKGYNVYQKDFQKSRSPYCQNVSHRGVMCFVCERIRHMRGVPLSPDFYVVFNLAEPKSIVTD